MSLLEFNIIGDIAGNYLTLMALLDKMPKGAIPVSVGDMVDRGPRSKQVLEFFMKRGVAVLGNHCHMMLDHFYNRNYYEPGLWTEWNGGNTTLKSFVDNDGFATVPKEVLHYIDGLPLFWRSAGLIVTHAPIRGDWTLDRACVLGDGFYRPSGKFNDVGDSIIWNRGDPKRKDDLGFQVFGHNSDHQVRWFADAKGKYAVCLDTSRAKKLSGMHWPSMEIFEQEYIG